jgi:leucyl aminopeptidase
MKISFDAKHSKAAALVVFAEAGGAVLADKKLRNALKSALKAEKFEGKKGQIVIVPGFSPGHIVVVGLGVANELTLLDFEKIGSSLVPVLNSHKVDSVEIVFDIKGVKKISIAAAAAQMAAGAFLNSYRFDKYLTKQPKEKKPTLKSLHVRLSEASEAKKIFSTHHKVGEAVFLVRDLVSEAPNVLYPESFADIIKKELTPLGIEVKILNSKDIEKLGMGALIAVGQGSDRGPRLVSMEYKGASAKEETIAFVGKGVTFDTGGISIKPAAGMEEMKFDMAGAGVVTGLLKALAARKAKVNAVGVVALAENMPSGGACRPGDIVTSMSGQTVEILNTDAEGRLILCDALWYCQEKFKPAQIVDLATLTGAIIIALGHEYGGLFSNDDGLAQNLLQAGLETGEHLWRMPLNEAWDKAIDSPAADIKNISGGRDAGSAVAAHFLKRFIQKNVKWAHLDIAGTAWVHKDRTGVPKGATGFGVRLLDRFVANHWEK